MKCAKFWAHTRTNGNLVHIMPDPEIGKQKPVVFLSKAETTPYIVVCLQYHVSTLNTANVADMRKH